MKKTVIAVSVALGLASVSAVADPLVISSGISGGTYHNVFGANLSLILREQRIDTTLEASRGSVENLDRIAAGEADVGFTQADALAAWLKRNPGAGVEIIGALGQECIYIATAAGGKIDDEDDLGKEGVKIAVGEQGTGSAESWGFLQTLESDYLKASTYHQGGIRTLAQVKTGSLDAFLWVTSPLNRNHKFLEAVNADNSGLRMINVNDWSLNDKLPNGEAVYRFEDVVIKEGFLSDTKVEVPCTDVLVVARSDAGEAELEAVATAVMMNSNRITGR